MKRFFKITLVLAFIGGGLFAAWWYFYPSKKIDGLHLVPDDAIYVLHTDYPVENWKKLSNSGVWQFLKQHPTFAEITSYANYLDTLILENKQVFNLVGHRDLFISAHKTTARDYDFLFAIDLGKTAGIDGLKRALQFTFERGGFHVTSRNHMQTEILEVANRGSRDVLFLSTMGNFLIGSYTSGIVEKSIEQHEQPFLARNNKFTELAAITDNDGLGRLYINYNYIDDFMACYMNTPDPLINDLSRMMQFTSAYFDINDNEVLAEGYSNLNDSVISYLRALQLSGKGANKAAQVLSNRTAVYLSLGFDNIAEFKTNLLQVMHENPAKEAEMNEGVGKIEKLLKISVDDHLLSWIGNEVAFVQNKPSRYNTREDDIVIAMQASDIGKAKEKLGFVHKQVKKRTPAKFKSMMFKNHEINYLEIKGFFKLFFGKLFDKLQKPYYTTIDDYVLFSNNPKTLVGLIMDYEEGRTLSEETGYTEFRNKFEEKSSMFCFISAPRMFPLLQKYSSAETWKDLRQSKNYITSFSHSGFQLTAAGNKFSAKLLLQFKPDTASFDTDEASIDSVSRAAVVDITSVLDSLDEADWFIVKQVQKGTYVRKYAGTDQPEVEAETDNGELNGDYREYYPNGQLRVEGQYRKGKKTGVWKNYNTEGIIEEKVKYRRWTEIFN